MAIIATHLLKVMKAVFPTFSSSIKIYNMNVIAIFTTPTMYITFLYVRCVFVFETRGRAQAKHLLSCQSQLCNDAKCKFINTVYII